MPKMIVSIDGNVIKEVSLTKDRTTLGRRPYNDIVIENLAVSGEHAVLQMAAGEVFLEDLNSTNGCHINGKAVKKQVLKNADVIEIGKCRIKFIADPLVAKTDKATTQQPVNPVPVAAPTPPNAGASTLSDTDFLDVDTGHACIKVLTGAASGREVALTKIVTTIGKPGVAVAAITRCKQGFMVHHVEGAGNPSLNGAPISEVPLLLKNGDIIELAKTQMQFMQT